ncbi:Pycsar system effector family protein [Actinacidiphila oryziradicis]|nr:Pycsar system effector family protein [Actinacidiphila oryziradicis]
MADPRVPRRLDQQSGQQGRLRAEHRVGDAGRDRGPFQRLPLPLDVSTTPGIWLLRTAMVLLAAAALLSIGVVTPRMRDGGVRQDWPDNFTYFGHLRLWEPDALAARLRGADPLTSLSRQIVAMSQIAWRKYVLVRLSLLIAAIGAACTVLAGLLG